MGGQEHPEPHGPVQLFDEVTSSNMRGEQSKLHAPVRKEKTMAKAGKAKRAAATKRKVSHIPKGYQAVTPYLSIRGAARAMDF